VGYTVETVESSSDLYGLSVVVIVWITAVRPPDMIVNCNIFFPVLFLETFQVDRLRSAERSPGVGKIFCQGVALSTETNAEQGQYEHCTDCH